MRFFRHAVPRGKLETGRGDAVYMASWASLRSAPTYRLPTLRLLLAASLVAFNTTRVYQEINLRCSPL